MVVQRREIAHTGALLNDRTTIGESNPKELQTGTSAGATSPGGGGAGARVVAVVAAMRASSSHWLHHRELGVSNSVD